MQNILSFISGSKPSSDNKSKVKNQSDEDKSFKNKFDIFSTIFSKSSENINDKDKSPSESQHQSANKEKMEKLSRKKINSSGGSSVSSNNESKRSKYRNYSFEKIEQKIKLINTLENEIKHLDKIKKKVGPKITIPGKERNVEYEIIEVDEETEKALRKKKEDKIKKETEDKTRKEFDKIKNENELLEHSKNRKNRKTNYGNKKLNIKEENAKCANLQFLYYYYYYLYYSMWMKNQSKPQHPQFIQNNIVINTNGKSKMGPYLRKLRNLNKL
ncbi:hypothetical protein HELRODRAFT_162996 [Helobdella robusta]|uniref:Uncharacterized protein n=1 Tax=Helobdella robusta TaxID=6412 RepID=T1ETI8_HELRO|nr:hypothetical protein HELRODRAFT_162996 [Helobdella robusta]ESN99447.1 hypothetical protein HELRODRAFT_162996 [Helobdella robusta]